jgi:hypothetical protein
MAAFGPSPAVRRTTEIGAQLSVLHAAGMSEFAPQLPFPTAVGIGSVAWQAEFGLTSLSGRAVVAIPSGRATGDFDARHYNFR